MIADEKAARQKKHEKRIVFHAFLLFKHRKRAFMKSEAKKYFRAGAHPSHKMVAAIKEALAHSGLI